MTNTIEVTFTEQQLHLLGRLADQRQLTIEELVAGMLVEHLPVGEPAPVLASTSEGR